MDSFAKIIGQEKRINAFQQQIEANIYPRCTMLVGPQGSGRKMLAKAVANALNADCVMCDNKIDTVRDVINLAHKSTTKTVFVFADIEKMSINAENALLKVLEEPPNNAYIIITAKSAVNALNTIRSRCVEFMLEPYTPQQILQYYKQLSAYDKKHEDVIVGACETPGDVEALISAGVTELYDYANLVADNIAEVSGANALKIGSRIAFKDTDKNKFDLSLFFKVFRKICNEKLVTDAIYSRDVYAKWILLLSHYMNYLVIRGVNKSMLFDMWVLDCRKIVLA